MLFRSLEKGQEITQEIVQTVYGGYFTTLTIWAVVMVVIALGSSYVIRKMLEKANESDSDSKRMETAEV